MDDAKVQELLKEYGKMIDDALEKHIPRKNGLVGAWLNEPIWYHMDTGGKRLRPALCLLTCEMLGADSNKALNFAVASELMHNAFLVHDDIMDGDKVRRSVPALWIKYGLSNGINVGTYMFAKSYHIISQTDIDEKTKVKLLNAFTLTYLKTGEGQALDTNLHADENFTMEKYLELAKLKTGYYFVCPIVGGAIIAGAPDAVIEKIWDLGARMGTAFQVRDDIIDLTEGKGRGVIGNDVREGKPSVLFAHALKHSSIEDKLKLLEIMKKPREKTTDADVLWVKGLYDKLGSIKYAEKLADELVKESMQIAEGIDFQKKGLLKQVASFVISRKT